MSGKVCVFFFIAVCAEFRESSGIHHAQPMVLGMDMKIPTEAFIIMIMVSMVPHLTAKLQTQSQWTLLWQHNEKFPVFVLVVISAQ